MTNIQVGLGIKVTLKHHAESASPIRVEDGLGQLITRLSTIAYVQRHCDGKLMMQKCTRVKALKGKMISSFSFLISRSHRSCFSF